MNALNVKINGEWNGQPLKLQLDHINGINDDNRLENLRFICPNCHSQTITYAGKNTKGVRGSDKEIMPRFKDLKKLKDFELWNVVKNDESIQFGSWGWKSRLGKLINVSSQKVAFWVKRVDPEIYKSIPG
jgi:hypothetical protein